MTSRRKGALALFESLPLGRLIRESGLGSVEALTDEGLELAFAKLSAAIRRSLPVPAA